MGIKFESTFDGAFTAEVTRSLNDATLGVKFAKNMTAPDVGVKYQAGLMTAALLASDKLSAFTGSVCYKVNNDVKVAGTVTQKGDLKGTVGCAYNLQTGTTVKAKVDQGAKLSLGVKHQLSKGFTVLMGLSCNLKNVAGEHSYGCQVSIE